MEAFSEGLRIVGVYFLSFSFILLRSIVVYLKSGSRLTFFLIFLHFLQKYRCVPKIGFSADIFIVNSIGIFICISIDIFIVIFIDIHIDIFIVILIGISIDIFIVIFIDISIDIFIVILIDISIDIFIVIFIGISIDIFIVVFIDIYIDTLTFIDKEVEEEGVDLFLKSNDPTPEGGEQTR